MSKKYKTKEWESKIKKACETEISMASACASLGMNKNTFRSHAIRLKVYKPNQAGKGMKKRSGILIPLEEIIVLGIQPQYGSSGLRLRLLSERIKPHKCEECKQKTWLKKKIPLELHHKDGNHHNHLKENLRLLCPNCHSLTNTYGSRNNK